MRRGGFTLIELLIVIAIVAVLAGAMIPMFRVTRFTAQDAKARSELDSIKTASMMYNQDTGQWPPVGNTGNGFITNGAGAASWNGPYLDEWRNDPWGAPYRIFDTGTRRDIESWGALSADGGTGTAADIGIIMTPNTSMP